MAHFTDGNAIYVDSDFLNKVRIPGVSLESIGFGEFMYKTPKGNVEVDRMRGKDFPGQSGRSHKLYDSKGGMAAASWLLEQAVSKNLSEGATEGSATASLSRLSERNPQGRNPSMRNLTASDRQALIRLVASLPKGDENRRVLLSSIRKAEEGSPEADAAALKADADPKSKDQNLASTWEKVSTHSKKAKAKWAVDPKKGETYEIGMPRYVFVSEFLGWVIENGEPRMKWKDVEDGGEWEAYLYDGVVSIGSSAHPLSVFGKA